MFKKIAIFTALALVLAVGVFGVVSTTFAQEVEVEESPEVQVEQHEQAQLEYEYAYQYGEGNGETDPIMTQTQTRTRTQDPELCDGEPQQLRIQTGAGNQGTMRQQRLNLGDGTCTGDCVNIRQNGWGN